MSEPRSFMALDWVKGEIEETLHGSTSTESTGEEWTRFVRGLRPWEILTILADLEQGRQVPRRLDDHRQVWATVHRREDEAFPV